MPLLFPITIEVEEIATGRVLRKLSAMEGIARIHLNLTQDKNKRLAEDDEAEELEPTVPTKSIAYRTDGRINTKGLHPSQNPAYRAIAEVLKQTPAHIKILSAALQRTGIGGPQAINGYIHRMSKLKLIKRTAPGTYRLADKGEKIFSAKAVTKALRTSSGGLVANNHAGVRHLVLSTLDQVDSMSSLDLNAVVTEAGYSPKNLSTTGMKMRNEGLIEVVNGHYLITQNGKGALEAPEQVDGIETELISNHSEEGLTANG